MANTPPVDDPGYHLDIARRFIANGDYAGAISSLCVAKELGGQSSQVDPLLGAAYLRTGQPEETILLLGPSRSQSDHELLSILGGAHLARYHRDNTPEDLESAVEALHTVHSATPGDIACAVRYLGALQESRRKPATARNIAMSLKDRASRMSLDPAAERGVFFLEGGGAKRNVVVSTGIPTERALIIRTDNIQGQRDSPRAVPVTQEYSVYQHFKAGEPLHALDDTLIYFPAIADLGDHILVEEFIPAPAISTAHTRLGSLQSLGTEEEVVRLARTLVFVNAAVEEHAQSRAVSKAQQKYQLPVGDTVLEVGQYTEKLMRYLSRVSEADVGLTWNSRVAHDFATALEQYVDAPLSEGPEWLVEVPSTDPNSNHVIIDGNRAVVIDQWDRTGNRHGLCNWVTISRQQMYSSNPQQAGNIALHLETISLGLRMYYTLRRRGKEDKAESLLLALNSTLTDYSSASVTRSKATLQRYLPELGDTSFCATWHQKQHPAARLERHGVFAAYLALRWRHLVDSMSDIPDTLTLRKYIVATRIQGPLPAMSLEEREQAHRYDLLQRARQRTEGGINYHVKGMRSAARHLGPEMQSCVDRVTIAEIPKAIDRYRATEHRK